MSIVILDILMYLVEVVVLLAVLCGITQNSYLLVCTYLLVLLIYVGELLNTYLYKSSFQSLHY